MTFVPIDIFFIVITVFLALLGAIKGLSDSVFGKLEFIAGVAAGIIFNEKVCVLLSEYISIQILLKIISFLILFIIAFLIVKIIHLISDKIFESNALKGLNRALGFFWGIAEGIVVVSFILVVLVEQPWFDVSGLLNESYFFDVYNSLRPEITQTFTESA